MPEKSVNDRLSERLAAGGFRFTCQREHVYEVLLRHPDHPTAEQVYMRAKQTMPDISLATVYNCLDALAKCHLLKEVTLSRGASRYCPNMREHGHFCCSRCGDIYDIDLPSENGQPPIEVPYGFEPVHFEIAVQGLCPPCGGQRKKNDLVT